ncbi:MAG TPA: AbrB/MazE/SpoVT family DNA-binding domain-containing protein [Candidatus Omnitrophica bacterium]|nr:AbrB/MazE/SpoVT family DNA-binding domain-containing protein [Candidatus Omnitrophota bacterium]HCI45279.1 AbrB/MazE/SpoVT family DNA-binding domain-containing protein [Candidatus Omnitrophota bacterium]
MKAAIIPVGNSKGIRIPKFVLEQCHIKNAVELEVKGCNIIIRPSRGEPREGWEEAFVKMAEAGDDHILMDDNLDLLMENWEWS